MPDKIEITRSTGDGTPLEGRTSDGKDIKFDPGMSSSMIYGKDDEGTEYGVSRYSD